MKITEVQTQNIKEILIVRSPTNKLKFDVAGVNKSGKPLVVFANDLEYDAAVQKLDALNTELNLV